MTAPAPTLDGRLLCASVTAYSILNGQLDPADAAPYYDGAGWESVPQIFQAGSSDINACLLGTTPDGLVLAFRGTLPPNPDNLPSLIDWLHDFEAEPVSVSGMPGEVHDGFWGDLQTLWAAVDAAVRQAVAGGGSPLPLYVTGHSKGGALAGLAAMALAQGVGASGPGESALVPTGIHTYAAPFAGDQAFATAYNARLGGVHVRWEYTDDLVPHLPPTGAIVEVLQALPVVGHYFSGWSGWNYEPLGAMRFIDWSGNIETDDTTLLEIERWASLTQLIAEAQFSTIAADHSAGCGGGYMSHIAPTGVCPVISAGQVATQIKPQIQRALAE